MAKRTRAVRSARRPAPHTRAASPLPRREAILDAALALIAEHGTEQLTHRSVAEAAGVALGSTTYYFASRDELVREAFRRYVVRALELLGAISREVPPADPAGLVELLVEIARRETSGGWRWSVVVEHELMLRAARDPELAAEFHGYERALASGLAEALEALGAPQPFDAARTLIAMVRGFELDGLTRPDADPDDLRRRLLPVVELVVSRHNTRPTTRTKGRPRPPSTCPGARHRKTSPKCSAATASRWSTTSCRAPSWSARSRSSRRSWRAPPSAPMASRATTPSAPAGWSRA